MQPLHGVVPITWITQYSRSIPSFIHAKGHFRGQKCDIASVSYAGKNVE